MTDDAHTVRTARRSPCPIACTLDIVGDRWSLLVVRDLLHGRRTFGDLLASPERIPTNILADRLKRLEQAGIVDSTPYQQRPVRFAYSLTEKGTSLGDVLGAIVRWGKWHIPGTRTRDEAARGGARRPSGEARQAPSPSARIGRRPAKRPGRP